MSQSYERWVVEKEGTLPEELLHRPLLRLTSLKQARKILERSCCSVNGKIERYASKKVMCGDSIEVYPLDEGKEESSCALLFEDNYLFVVNKPAGISVEEESIRDIIPVSMSANCFLVHRLDKWTSGALVIAKDQKTQYRMEQLFRERKIKKEYLAIVDGCVEKEEGIVTRPLEIKRRCEGEVFWGVAAKGGGLESSTQYKTLLRSKKESLMRIIPKTGRTHQIRVHMASIGHPILGDGQYAISFRTMHRPFRHMLHALKIIFKHPILDKTVFVRAPVPNAFQKIATDIFGEDFEKKLCEL